MKKYYKSQQLRLPLIQHFNQPLFNKHSKDSTKRSNVTSKNSYDVRSRQKQKKSQKASNFIPIKQNKSLLQNRSLDEKQLSRSMKNSIQQTLTDFQQKIKQNKILLKKYKLQKLIEKQQNNDISQKVDSRNYSKHQSPIKTQTNLSQLDIFTQSKSKKLLSHLNNKLNLQFRQSQQTSKSQLEVITEDPDTLQETLNKRKNHLQRLNKKIKGDDIFENIHILLEGLRSDDLAEKSYMQKKKIFKNILKYKQKLQKLQPNSQLLEYLNIPQMDKKQSLPFLPKVNNEKEFYKTKSPWERVLINKKEIKKFSSSFDQQIEKVDFYLNKSSTYLDQLLKNRIEVLDLKLIQKIKEKKRINKS